MNLMVSLIVAGALGFGAFLVAGILAFEATGTNVATWIVGLSVGGVVARFLFVHLMNQRRQKTVLGIISGALEDITGVVLTGSNEMNMQLYAIADEELSSGNVDKGIWALALVKARGDAETRKSEYLKLRVKELKHAEQ